MRVIQNVAYGWHLPTNLPSIPTSLSGTASLGHTTFSEYHPENIIPDQMDEFFEKQFGSPSEVCITRIGDSQVDELERAICDGLLPMPIGNPALGWNAKSYCTKS